MKHPVRKLVYKFILIGIPLFVMIAYTWIFPMNYMAVEYAMWVEERDYTRDGSDARNLVIGDSRAKSGLMPVLLSDDTYNMAVGGTTSIEMYYALNNYLKHHAAPENVMIIFAPYHFCDIDNWNQTLYYNYLTPLELAEVYQNAYQTEDPVILSESWFADTISYQLRLPNKYLAAQYNAGFFGRRQENQDKYRQVQTDLGYTAFGTDSGNDAGNYETHHEIFDQSELVKLYYYKLLDLCSANNIRVTIEQSPVNQASYDVITDEFWNGYRAFLDETASKYPNFTINREVIAYNNKYFGDNNHLNPDGAKIFTQEIKEKYPDIF